MLSVTQHVECALDSGKKIRPLVTFSFDGEGCIRAVFCADFKAGTAMHTIVMDACVLLSRLLQQGSSPQELADAMAKPPSIVGAMAQAAADLL